MAPASKRRWALALALSVVVAAALHAGDPQDPPGSQAANPKGTPMSSPRAPAPNARTSVEPLPRLELDRLQSLASQRRAASAANDPFAVPVTAEARALAAAAVAPPPPPPQAPAIPFRFLGVQEADGVQLVFLEQQNRTHIARPGEEVSEGWRLDRLTQHMLEFTYVPLGQQRTLPIGGAS